MVVPTMSTQQDPQLYTQFAKAVEQIRSAKGLIVDIRNNEGGGMWHGAWFAQHFYTSVQEPLEFRGLKNVGSRLLKTDVIPGDAFPHVKLSNPSRSSSFTPWYTFQMRPLQPHIAIPTAVLINGWNASAAENFIAFMQVAKNVKTFGSRTMGADGSPVSFAVMKGVRVEVSSWQDRIRATGLPIEGVGIQPEVPVTTSYGEFLNELQAANHGQYAIQYDAALQTALHWLHSRIH